MKKLVLLSMMLATFSMSANNKVILNLEAKQNVENFVKKDNFEKIIDQWKDILIGYKYFDDSTQMKDLQKKQDEKTLKIWNSLNKEENRKYLWEFKNYDSASITKSYRNIEVLAISVMNPKSKYYLNQALLNDVIAALNWMKENRYNEKIKADGNWWDYEIGTPRAINDIFVMLYPVLEKEYIKDYLKVITHFVPDANKNRGSVNPNLVVEATGANQIDISKVKILQSALLKDEKGLIYAKNCLNKVFPFVEKGDGFYKDGSFIQHDSVAYTGAYGNVLIDGLSQLMTLLENTKYNFGKANVKRIDFWIKEAFSPIMYQGLTMSMVKGRSITRKKVYLSSSEIVRAIIRLAYVENNVYYKQLAKSYIQSNTLYDYIENLNSYRDIYLAKKIMQDKKINALDLSENILKFYKNMDRVVYKNKKNNFAIGLSMSSDKIKYYEAMNGENERGWYTGDGMLYLYNGDIRQFNDEFWSTVDPYRLPGITVDKAKREDASGSVEAKNSSVSGKVINNKKGIFKMHISNYLGTLSLDKKWTILNDKIKIEAKNIKFKKNSIIESIIENRKLNDDTNYIIYINNKEINLNENEQRSYADVKEVLLKSDKKNETIKYVFKKPQKIYVMLEKRCSQSDKKIKRKYFTMWLRHEKQNDTFEYEIYPL